MAVLLVLPLVFVVGVLLEIYADRHRPTGRFRPPAPWGSPSQDRDRERLIAELRELGAADPPRLLS